MSFLELFEKEFAPKLDTGPFKRASGFRKMFEHLDGCAVPYIIETGTMRSPGNWSDGQSTLLWDAFVRDCRDNGRPARAFSIDINRDYLLTASKHARVVDVLHGDSVKVLCTLEGTLEHADLVYLDSFDLDQSNPTPSALHHLMELTAIFRKLPSGCMVTVDDCISDECGKHILVKKFFEQIGVRPAFTGYQHGWIIP